MKRTITTARFPISIIIDTELSFWGFRPGDIITNSKYNSVEIILGFEEGSTNKRVGMCLNPGDIDNVYIVYGSLEVPPKFYLLERPGYKFKVGDRVKAVGEDTLPLGEEGKVILIAHDFLKQGYFVEFENWHDGLDGSKGWWGYSWFPDQYKISSDNRWCCYEDEIELITNQTSASVPANTVNNNRTTQLEIAKENLRQEEVGNMAENAPAWFREMMTQIKAGTASMFILWGNIYDLMRNAKGKHLPLKQYLLDIFENRDMVITYSLSGGLSFIRPDIEQTFKQKYASVSLDENVQIKTSAKDKAAQSLDQARADAPAELSLGKSPEKILPMLERAMADNSDGAGKKSLIIDYAHNLAPNLSGNNFQNSRIITETFERWSRDSRIKEAGNIILLLTPELNDLASSLRSSQTAAAIIRIPKPDEAERIVRLENKLVVSPAEDGLDAAVFGRITSGLTLRQIDDILSLAKVQGRPLSLDLIKDKKREVLNNEFGDDLAVIMPRWGFDYFGGKEELKEYFWRLRQNILKGLLRRVPMGILAGGPPGTGKTFFFECWAHECGFNFVKIVNARNMYVGASEDRMKRMLHLIDDLAPTIVVEDEADQSELPRDAYSGDTGVSNHLRQMKFEFCSDPKRRGRVIWTRISNRGDLIDNAYKRRGRTDKIIPFLLPRSDEYQEIFRVMFRRYDITTDIVDFSQFAKRVAEKIYCTGADVEGVVLDADEFADLESLAKVGESHLTRAIDQWRLPTDTAEINRQIITALQGCAESLCRDWREQMLLAQARLAEGPKRSFE